jgi:hypothetical protein
MHRCTWVCSPQSAWAARQQDRRQATREHAKKSRVTIEIRQLKLDPCPPPYHFYGFPRPRKIVGFHLPSLASEKHARKQNPSIAFIDNKLRFCSVYSECRLSSLCPLWPPVAVSFRLRGELLLMHLLLNHGRYTNYHQQHCQGVCPGGTCCAGCPCRICCANGMRFSLLIHCALMCLPPSPFRSWRPILRILRWIERSHLKLHRKLFCKALRNCLRKIAHRWKCT